MITGRLCLLLEYRGCGEVHSGSDESDAGSQRIFQPVSRDGV